MEEQKSEEELRLFRPPHSLNWYEYQEESWRVEVTCCQFI